ncbi:hypothetical protein C1637_13310 [Chryseobacterium lactis]|uniref:Uncharacterized protein n=1 Tax=Chryseobacterium lactis TaxID=1241981 RepID=A0A3G6RS38_CHRLC|nr:hypothetical protein [Chryseobacterium lactis]AZA83894.1 hypothetical protein EG342_19255 [Chryseobacterium lactis]AZB04280.1 hypothetical protein EG341_10130 [Chryseobacterium lactis]PNW12812.1 hypothetical protein C1637_13310 [Chryseobacterium lactis]
MKNTTDYLKENNKFQDTSYYTILYYGYPNTSRLELMEMISEKWKIKHIEAAGCDVEEKEMIKIDRQNKKTYAAIEKKYGKDWKVKYEDDLQNVAMKKVDIMDVLITNKTFRTQLEKCNIEIDGVDKDVKPLNNSTYEVKVYGFTQDNKKIDCCTVNVDLINRTVNIIK